MDSIFLLLVFFFVQILYSHSFFSKNKFKYVNIYQSSIQSSSSIEDVFVNKLKESTTYLLNKRVLNKALQNLELEKNVSNSKPFTSGDCKTVLVACVNNRDLELTDKLLSLIKLRDLLTPDLLYVGIQYACKKMAPKIAYRLLLYCQENSISTDIDTVNQVIICLGSSGYIDEACDVLEKLTLNSFGKFVQSDITTYTKLISFSENSLERHMQRVLKCLNLMSQNPNIKPLSDQIFISSLKLCLFSGDVEAAKEIFEIYENYFGIVKTKAYNLLLMTLINSKKLNDFADDSIPRFFSDKIRTIIKLNLDTSPVVSNLILRSYCYLGYTNRSNIYFRRMIKLSIQLFASTIDDYSELIVNSGDRKIARNFHNYLLQNGFQTSRDMINFMNTS